MLFALTPVLHNRSNLSDDQAPTLGFRNQSAKRPKKGSLGDLPPKDKYGDIYLTMWFKPHTGISELIYDITSLIKLKEARNIRFKFSVEENLNEDHVKLMSRIDLLQGYIN